MSLWRKIFGEPHRCRICKDTGLQSDGYAVRPCANCRDLEQEFQKAAKKFMRCECKPFHLSEKGFEGWISCDTCGIVWGRSP